MGGVAGGLRSSNPGQGILHGVWVESQLLGEIVEVLRIRTADINPHQTAILVEVVGEQLEREVLGCQGPVTPQPAADRSAVSTHTHSVPLTAADTRLACPGSQTIRSIHSIEHAPARPPCSTDPIGQHIGRMHRQ